MASAVPVPMVTDKGKGPVLTAEVPWSEKYRPKTLDEVAAHKDIIETSTCYLSYRLGSSPNTAKMCFPS
jgi:hypothetical protein